MLTEDSVMMPDSMGGGQKNLCSAVQCSAQDEARKVHAQLSSVSVLFSSDSTGRFVLTEVLDDDTANEASHAVYANLYHEAGEDAHLCVP